MRAQVPADGDSIPNTARLEYTDSLARPWMLMSNTVVTVASAVPEFTLTADRMAEADSGQAVVFAHTLSNVGEGPDSYTVTAANLGGDGYDLVDLRIVRDLDRDGIADADEPEIAPEDALTLAAGESTSLLVTGVVPVNESEGLSSQVTISATSRLSAQARANNDTAATPLRGAITLEKTVSRDTAEAGDSILYTLEIANTANVTMRGVLLRDHLPAGITFIPGTARLDGAALANPDGGRGPQLVFSVGQLGPRSTRALTYLARIESDAPSGRAINTARVDSSTPSTSSNSSSAGVVIDDGVFTDKAVIIGKVFVDADGDRLDRDETGVPGVRVLLEDGTSAVTDSEGKYSFYGVRPVAHVLKLDRTTLPAGARLIALDTRSARDAGSRYADVKRGELHKADFALEASDPAVVAEVTRRRDAGEVNGAEIERSLRERIEPDGQQRPVSDPRALPASGTIGGSDASAPGMAGPTTTSSFRSVLPRGTLTSLNSSLPPAPVAPVAQTPLEAFVEAATDSTPGFLGLSDGVTVPGRQLTVRVKGPVGARFELLLNDQPVAASRLGKKAVNVATQVEATEYLGIDLAAGANTLTLVVRDTFGNERSRVPVKVVAPDRLARLGLAFSETEPVADGHTPVHLLVRLHDQAGTAISARTPLTLETSLGRWQAQDVDPREPGTQVFIDGGQASFALLPPDTPGDCRVIVSSGAIREEVSLPFMPDLRPMVASGIVEGRVFIRSGGLALAPTRAEDAFEEELGELASSDDLRATGRAAFFLKGKVRGDMLLTAAYDSDKQTHDRLFRDIEPDRYYPVYGDSSLRGFDAQSTRRLYVRIDRKRSYLLLGDFTTQSTTEQAQLANYQRSLNGVRGHFENTRASVNAWAAHDTTTQVVQELPADGTSGPYGFRQSAGLINSETVEILTRDRNQPSLILRTEPMTRHADYEFEPLTGRILFREPIRSLDENLNPRSIRVTFEADTGGSPFWTYGADGQLKVASRVEVGGSFVQDENPIDQRRLISGNTTVKVAENTFVLGELAQTDTDSKGTGLAGRVDLRHHDERTDARLYFSQTESRFLNPGALLTPGRIESGAKIVRTLDERNRLIVQGLITEDTATNGGRREGSRADIEHTFANKVRLEMGARWSEETENPAGPTTAGDGTDPATDVTPFEVRSLRVKATTPLPHVRDTSIYGEYEQDLFESDQRLLALGGDWQFATRGRAYLRHEFISALGGPFELNQTQENNITVLGVETDYMRDGRIFNEYRARDAFSGRETEASTGVRNQFSLRNGLRLSAGIERVTPFDGSRQNEATAVTTGYEYTANPLWKSTGRLEARWADTSDSLLNTLGYARKLSRDWTFLGKSTTYLVRRDTVPGSQDCTQLRLLSGLAWRQTQTDVWNALAKYEYRWESGSPFDATLDSDREVHLVSGQANWQPDQAWIVAGRWAFKAVDETISGQHSAYFGQQANLRILREVSRRWDAGLSVAAGASRGLDRYDWAVGPEIGYSVRTNLRVGLGYNIAGFYDRDLAGDQPTSRGLFLSMRFKFDEDLLGDRHRGERSE